VLTLRAVPGCGVEAEIEIDERHTIRIGTRQWIIADFHAPHESELIGQLKASGHTIHIALDGELVAIAVHAERLRDSARDAIGAFHRLGLPVEVLTGDSAERAQALGLPNTRAGMLPDDKRAAVEVARAGGDRPLFVGDGINDAAALATAHVGVSLSSAADIAVAASDVTLYHGDLRVIPWAIELSREAVERVRRSLHRALGYNLIGMTLAACGILHPIVAALVMLVSSLSLVFFATRVGVRSNHCPSETAEAQPKPAESPNRAVWHGLAFTLQGAVFLLVLESAREPAAAVVLLGAFALVGSVLAYLWYRWAAIPHALDMGFGMLTFGNLGMLLGWWADNGFTTLADSGCCACVATMRDGLLRPWMWVEMLAFANVAMLCLGRQATIPGARHVAAMLTGGNVGMVLGMLAGGWCASQINTDSATAAVAASFMAMTAGMLAGMLLGTRMADRLIEAARAIRAIPRWLRGHAGNLSYEYRRMK
jgi:hypothetical protein